MVKVSSNVVSKTRLGYAKHRHPTFLYLSFLMATATTTISNKHTVERKERKISCLGIILLKYRH